MEGALVTATHHVHDIHITDRARVHFGDHIGDQHFAGGLTIRRSDLPQGQVDA